MTSSSEQPPKELYAFRCTDCKDINCTCTLVTEDGESKPIWCPYTIIEGKTPWKKVKIRPHPAPAPASTNGDLLSGFVASTNCGNCDEWDAACDELTRMVYFKTKRMDIRSLVAEAAFSVRQDQNWMQRHDAAIARQARYELLDKLKEHTKKYRAYRKDGSIEWSSMINPNDLDAFIESLRSITTPQSEQEQPR